MNPPLELVLFDIGGVLGSNGWDREQRNAAIEKFGLDPEDFQYRHEETVGAFESGHITLDEYLDVTVFCEDRAVSREDFKQFMFAQSVPWPESIAIARELAETHKVRLATLNNESEELNQYRIKAFGLHDIFPTFFTSCWLGVRKPMRDIYERVLGMTQTDPHAVVFVDDRAQNLHPAATLGIRTIQFTGAEKLRRDLQQFQLL
jgi:putative hydrolase of the HAD superfamily